MNDSLFMSVIQSLRDLRAERGRFGFRKRSSGQSVFQRDSANQVTHQVD